MPIIKDAVLKDYAYYGTGGPCAVLYVPESPRELTEHVRAAKRRDLPLLVLGGGTNSLVMDEPYAGACVLMRGLNTLKIEGTALTVGAGVDNSLLAQNASKYGLAGAAWMFRLPGQLGGTVRMNARCYGGEISQIVRRVSVVTAAGEARDYTDRTMFRGYKDTIFMASGDLIVEATIELSAGDQDAVQREMKACEQDRTSKGQFAFPSCGCVFKNDYTVGVPSGMLLAAAGAKSLKRGGAEVSQHHANFVYNKGASSRDILELTLAMRDLVYREFGVWMSYEMDILGSVPSDLAAALAVQEPQRVATERLAPLREKLAKHQSL